MKLPKHLLLVLIIFSVLVALFYGYTIGFKDASVKTHAIDSFADCVAAGNPILKSYPAQCVTKDGRHFVEEVKPVPPAEGVFCTMDAKVCPDGTTVGRVAPNCEFAPCPGK